VSFLRRRPVIDLASRINLLRLAIGSRRLALQDSCGCNWNHVYIYFQRRVEIIFQMFGNSNGPIS